MKLVTGAAICVTFCVCVAGLKTAEEGRHENTEVKDNKPRNAGSLPPLVPPSETDPDDDFFDERDAFNSDDMTSAENDARKRAMGMLRLGRNSYPADGDKRAMGMLRLGRGGESNSEQTKRSMGMLRLGRGFDADEEEEYADDKRAMGMLRLGRGRPSDGQVMDKKAMGMLRLGRGSEEDKRSMGMLRLGRRASGPGQ